MTPGQSAQGFRAHVPVPGHEYQGNAPLTPSRLTDSPGLGEAVRRLDPVHDARIRLLVVDLRQEVGPRQACGEDVDRG